jgi:F0F1-type ATP synthase membrane subunit c/vacuolar-type H+-ATPase subunit K
MVDDAGSVPVDINIQFYTGPEAPSGGPSFSQLGSGFFSVFDVDRLVPMSQPVRLLKTILAAIIALLTIVLCFRNFGRVGRAGIEAAGRNPLAGRLITGSIILNVVFTLITGIVGLGLAYLIFVV